MKHLKWTARLSAALFLSAFLLIGCEREQISMTDLPWQITLHEDGSSTVFGVHIGTTSVLDARYHFNAPADVGLFISPEGGMALEAFFGSLSLSGLKAKVIAEIQASPDQLKALADRPVTRNPTPSGSVKLELSEEDLFTIQEWPVASLTYAPVVDLPEDVVKARFGDPQQTLSGPEGEAYWLYPQLGLSITLAEGRNDILQYVPPRDFPRLKQRLEDGLAKALAES